MNIVTRFQTSSILSPLPRSPSPELVSISPWRTPLQLVLKIFTTVFIQHNERPLLEKEIKMTCCASGQSRSAPGGVWVQGGGIEIPCVYEIGVKKGIKSLRKELRQTNTTRSNHWQYNLGRHPEPTHVAVKTWNWTDEFCLICLWMLVMIYFITV